MENSEYICSTPIEGSKQPGASHIYRHPHFMKQLLLTPTEGITNLKDLILDIFLTKFPNRKFLGKINIQNVQQNGVIVQKRSIQNILTYRQGFRIASKLATALLNKKLIHEESQSLKVFGVYSRNRQQLYLADLAFIIYGITCVPLYDTLGIDNLDYCLDHSQISTCICSTSNAKTLLTLKNTANLKTLILCDPVQEELLSQLKKKFEIYDFWKLIEQVKEEDIINHQLFKIQPTKCFTFSYTSGTTGPPKGAMLSHHNFLSFVAGHKVNLKTINRNSEEQCHISILPLPHVYERIVILYQMFIGSFIVPSSGNPLKLKEDIALVKPTQLIAVPRLFNRIIQNLYDAFGGQQNLRKLIDAKSPILQKVRQGFGGRIKFLLSGSAPINPKILDLFGKIMNCPFLQAYGQTQNTGGAFIQDVNDKSFDGNIGHIWPSLQFKLVDIPQMGYTSDDKDANGNSTPRGQIWLRGYGVILGYYKMPQITKQTITEDGWLKTGDVGSLSPHTNNMKLIDRKKNIFKLSQGQYVSSQKVEFYYLKSKFVTEAFLYGDSFKDYPVCIIVPNKLELQKAGKELNIQKNYLDLCEDKQIIKHVHRDLMQRGFQGKLNGFQQAKNIRFQPEAFAIRGIVSSTMKLQRFEAKNFYKARIQEMYAQGDLTKSL